MDVFGEYEEAEDDFVEQYGEHEARHGAWQIHTEERCQIQRPSTPR